MIHLLPDRREIRRMLHFLVAGLVNTAFGYATYAVCVAAGGSPTLSVIVSTIAGVCFNFQTLSSVFVSSGWDRLPRFVAVYAVLTPLNIGLIFLTGILGAGPYLGGAIALAVVTPLTYLAMRLFVFTPHPVFDRAA